MVEVFAQLHIPDLHLNFAEQVVRTQLLLIVSVGPGFPEEHVRQIFSLFVLLLLGKHLGRILIG